METHASREDTLGFLDCTAAGAVLGPDSKQFGSGHIAGLYAEQLHAFNRDVLSPYLNYHRPCYFPCEQVDTKGKLRKRYRGQDITTLGERLKSLSGGFQGR